MTICACSVHTAEDVIVSWSFYKLRRLVIDLFSLDSLVTRPVMLLAYYECLNDQQKKHFMFSVRISVY